ncbi:MAG: hypothetical protein SFV23_09515 [Planctomycetaceae bacterium]|nr:hypothetical protein [Planctomycetaceae bacterium]
MKPVEFDYYADGKRIVLTLSDEVVAIRQDCVTQPGRLSPQRRRVLEPQLRPLLRGWSLTESRNLTPAERAELQAEGSLQPVFEAAGAQLVALPEVRVEETRPQQQNALKHWLERQEDLEVESGTALSEITVVRPRSGRGEDAVRLASRVFQEVHPEAATPRFLRVVRRPHPGSEASIPQPD